jgi:hypothetical protein
VLNETLNTTILLAGAGGNAPKVVLDGVSDVDIIASICTQYSDYAGVLFLLTSLFIYLRWEYFRYADKHPGFRERHATLSGWLDMQADLFLFLVSTTNAVLWLWGKL